ncbi:arf-GAP with coiled-coil, ANK repeat and PH domain-containing protein 2 isoform X1 [Triplophysa dalaica]|uniref:arf-GAP with coiled-coil, ANK repeat and PH domain-containing protein 2 isoform X1 n=1 Tax=Triplophysa dalaica TaxID=1582913 RepID=UPI0024DF39D8|nr:arf-GAP with coiled-coil, ANK repeat and PH domain-containing protein 2 isoform X1 [Triplophysa dalaica]XP_056598539.1 arf-GAP with coiled-coil, ANK repeat and PH domain-containing protein 2 isoform X1 [Triplophysa dalaica]
MKVTVDFEECLKDSPRFRATVEEVEGDVGELESKLDKLVKLCIGMIDAGRVYNQANKQFVNGIRELALQSTRDEVIGCSLASFAETLLEMNNYHTILFDQAQRSIKSQLQAFVKEDLKKFKDAKKHFDKVSEEKEVALVKNSQVPRNKQHEVEEATNILTTTRKCFRHIALDYVLQINVLQSKRRLEILKSMLSYMNSNFTFFHQGYDLFSQLQPLMKQLGGQLDQLVVDSAKEKRDMEQKHSTIQQKAALQDFSTDDTKLEYNVDTENGIAMEGYLFKRASNAFKSWNRRWFSIQNSQLVYQKKFRDNPTVVVEDLRLCTVKHYEDIERRFCFEVVSPSKSWMMQADSEKLRQAWIKAVQNSIATAYRENGEEDTVSLDRNSSASLGSLDSGCESVKPVKGESALQRVQAIPGNEFCCDCGQSDPRWASINLGITLCIECSGIHRSLGVHNSKVRSLTLDSWEPELLKLMCELGNGVVNHIYEARREEMVARKPQPGDSRQEIEAFIRAKYIERRFVVKPTAQEQKEKIMALRKHDKRVKGNMEFLPPRPPPPTPKLRTTSSTSASLSGHEVRRDSLFCPDELDSLFSYFDTSSKLRSLRSADSGIQNSADGSREMLASSPSSNSLSEAAQEPQESDSPVSVNQMDGPPVFSELTDFSAGPLLYWASCAGSLTDMVEALAHGADVNWVNGEDSNRTPLIQAVQGGSLITCEFLLQNAANVDQQDIRGRGPLHHATILAHTGQVCLFLKRGGKQNTVDVDGRSPLSIAVEAANADIVTLLRLAKMNEEMKGTEGAFGQSGQYSHSQSHTEQQYKKCIQEFITSQLQES